ncbi:MAG: YggT family protein [Gammaproteobacteria bacterium]|jgi:YggT family protein|nr:YggT family protein [Gammaproteobacteria bacterium]MDP6164766.1 YggT family protein [Gammaproteobacteria bacterium]
MPQAAVFLVQTLLGLYVMILLIRLLLQFTRADFYNPIAQALVKVTQPVVSPLQKVLPRAGRLSLPTLVVAIVVQALLIAMVFMLSGLGWPNLLNVVIWSLIGIASQILDILFFAILGSIILSWVAPQSHHPATLLLRQITEPVMAPARRLLPNLGGLDFSPIVVFIVINLVEMMAVYPLAQAFGMPRGLIVGL